MSRSRWRGFAWFELDVATVIAALLTSLLLVRLQSYQREARQLAVQRLVGTLRTALSVKRAHLSVVKKERGLLAVIDENPLSWLVEVPGNYLGEYYSPQAEVLPDDSWYFGQCKKELVYSSRPKKLSGNQT